MTTERNAAINLSDSGRRISVCNCICTETQQIINLIYSYGFSQTKVLTFKVQAIYHGLLTLRSFALLLELKLLISIVPVTANSWASLGLPCHFSFIVQSYTAEYPWFRTAYASPSHLSISVILQTPETQRQYFIYLTPSLFMIYVFEIIQTCICVKLLILKEFSEFDFRPVPSIPIGPVL